MEPGLEISISEDRLQAHLHVSANYQAELTHIASLVSERGICFGLKPEAIQSACVLCNTERNICIAEGQAANVSRNSGLRKAINAEQRTVEVGEFLGELMSHNASNTHGIDVFGKRIVVSQKSTMLCIGAGIEIRAHKMYAGRAGIFMVDANMCYQVTDSCVDSAVAVKDIKIELSTDNMEAFVCLKAKEYAESTDLAHAVQQSKISFGLLNSGLHDAISAVNSDRSIVIARGKDPEHGNDAYLEYFIDDRLTFSKDVNGNLDFRTASLHKSVKKGTLLARLHPASQGNSGMDILGNRIDAKDGNDKDINEFLEEGAAQSPEDPMLIIAERDGIYNKSINGAIGVLECLEINGDVDLSVGNIDTPYPVIIHGDIKAGFQVKSGSDITVNGLIEDARVSAGGNITVAKGVLPGTNRIKARGDIAALYIRERETKAHSVIVSKSIRRSQVFANQDVVAQEILGGVVHAGHKIEVERLGSDSGHRTEVKAGIDPYINNLLQEAITEHQQQHQESKKLEPQVESTRKRAQDLGKKFKNLAHSGQQNASYLEQLRQQAKRALDESVKISDTYRAAIHKQRIIGQNIELYQQQLHEQQNQSTIEISDTVFPPVKIQIGPDAHYRVQAAIMNLTFTLDSKGEIQLIRHRGKEEAS